MAGGEEKDHIKVLVFGGGSIGALYSYHLETSPLARVSTTIVCRSNFHEVSAHGYSLTTSLWGNHDFRPTSVISSLSEIPPAEVESFDYVLDTTKTLGSGDGRPPLAAALAGNLPAATPIILIKNGLDIESPYLREFPRNPIVLGVAYISLSQPAPGKIVQEATVSHLHIGPCARLPPRDQEKVSRLGVTLGASCRVTVHDDIRHERWRKLAWNGSWNTACAAAGLDTQGLLKSSPAAVGLVTGLLKEIVATAEAVGVEMGPVEELIKSHVGWVIKARAITPSMLQDARKGLQMEVEVICGNVWRAAERAGVETPHIKSVYAVLAGMNWRFKNAHGESG